MKLEERSKAVKGGRVNNCDGKRGFRVTSLGRSKFPKGAIEVPVIVSKIMTTRRKVKGSRRRF